jgi:hypothetical protein
MKQQIILNNCECEVANKVSENSTFAIKNGSTFKLTYHFSPLSSNNLSGVDLRKFDLKAEYWVYGDEENKLTFTSSNISSDNTLMLFDESIIKFIFRNYNLRSGRLYVRMQFRILDESVPDKWVTDYYEGFTGIILN